MARALLLAACFLVWRLVAACGPEFGDHGTMTGDQDVLENGTLVINCTISERFMRDDGVNSSALFFKSKQFDSRRPPLPAGYVFERPDNHTLRMRVERARLEHNGTYFCYSEAPPEKPKLICLSKATIGWKPLNVSDEHFWCVLEHGSNLTCRWRAPRNPIATEYRLRVALYGKYTTAFSQACGRAFVDACTWDSDTQPPFIPRAEYHFVLQGANSHGTSEQVFHRHAADLLLPGPVVDLTARALGPTNATVGWTAPTVLKHDSHLLPHVHYTVAYWPLAAPHERRRLAAPFNATDAALAELVPFTTYNVTVTCDGRVHTGVVRWTTLTTAADGE